MAETKEDMLRMLTLEVLHIERKNLRSKALTDQRMSEELQKIIMEYAKRAIGHRIRRRL